MPSLTHDIASLVPHGILFSGTIISLLAASFTRQRFVVPAIAVLTMAVALWSLFALGYRPAGTSGGLMRVDGLFIMTAGPVLFASLCISLLAYPYLRKHEVRTDEFFLLLMISTLGGLVLASSTHFAALFLGIELISIPLVSMAAYRQDRAGGLEAGFKYLVLAGMSSALLLFGIALLYADTGSLAFAPARIALQRVSAQTPLFHLGIILLVAGLGFKLGLVPFHFWAPDVYEGAPAPVTAFAATVSKASVITVLLRIFPPPVIEQDRFLFTFFCVLSLASMVLGNVLALRQNNVKRMLAYSSIAHSGYLLVAFLSGGPYARTAVILYLISYVLANLSAFGVVSLLSGQHGDAGELNEYAGLAWRSPWLAGIMTLSILSLLGIPLTVGFIAKYSVAAAGMDSAHTALVIALVLNTALSAAYYLRLIMTMFLGAEEGAAGNMPLSNGGLPVMGTVALTVAAALLLLFGILPQYLIDVMQKLVL